MDFNIIKLLLQTPDNRSCKHNIPNGTKPYDEYFFQINSFVRKGRDFYDLVKLKSN
jgi:hypothetical protein